MKVRVRRAKPGDRGLFRKLWKEHLEHQEKLGHDILANEQNLDTFTKLFDFYVNEEVLGVVLFVAEDAVLLWGSTGALPPFECRYGSKPAMAWGSYVRESHKEARGKMEQKAISILKEWGFDHILRPIFREDKDQLQVAEQLGFDPDTSLTVLELDVGR